MGVRSLFESDAQYFVINKDTRVITPPADFKNFGVESDENSNRVYFQCPRYVGDSLDLATLSVRVNFQNANSEKDQYIVTDVTVDGENVYFSWVLSRKATAYKGSVYFIVCAVKTNSEGVITNEWNTTMASGTVLSGLEVETPVIPEDTLDVVNQLLSMVNTAASDLEAAASNAKEAVKTAEAEAIEAVSRTPNGVYANALKGSASGEVIAVNDVAPVEHNVAVKVKGENIAPETVTLTRCGKNILPSIDSYTNSGYTANVNADGSITVSGSANVTNDIYFNLSTASVDMPVRLTKGQQYAIQGWSSNGQKIYVKTNNLNGESNWTNIDQWAEKNVGTDYTDIVHVYTESKGHEIGDTSLCGTYKVQLEVGGAPTDFEPYQGVSYTPDSNGNVNAASITPNMTLSTDTKGAVIDCEYNKDSNIVIQQLVDRITALENS